jgi:hypothetical protein
LKILSAASLERVPSPSHLSYSERLTTVDMELLELRRLKFDLIQSYRVPGLLTILCESIADSDTDMHSKKLIPILPVKCIADTDTLTDSKTDY